MADNKLPLFEGAGKFYVYVYRDPRPGKKLVPIYVGKGTAAHGRADVHWKKGARNPLLKSVLGKIKGLGLEPLIEIVGWFDDEAEAFKYERHLIDKIGIRSAGGTLCNLLVGDPGGGWSHSEETRQKLSLARKGMKMGPPSTEIRAKIAAALIGRKLGPNPQHAARLKGRKLSYAHRAAISAGNIGRVFSDETRAKIGKGNRGKLRTPETIEKLRTSHVGNSASPETREKMSSSHKARWETIDRRARSDAVAKALANPEARRKMQEAQKRRATDPEYKARQSEIMRKWWEARKASVDTR